MSSNNGTRMPTIFLPHGGGPWPWMDLKFMVTDGEKRALTDYLEGLVAQLPRRPRAMVVVSAHWEAPVPTVMTNPRPPILYDYYNFPPETYQIHCLLYTSPSPRDGLLSRMPSSA